MGTRLLSTCIFFCVSGVLSVMAQGIQFSPEEKEWIIEHPVIEFGYEPNWEPYEIYKNGVYTGIVGDYISEIELATGIKMIPIKNISWNESLEGLKNGSIHVVPSCGITPERTKYLDFTAPYIKDPLMISTHKDYGFVGSLKDLEGKTIALPKNYYTSELISNDHPNINIIELNSVQECLESLRDGKVDAFVGSLGVISYYINKRGFNTIKVAAPTQYEGTIVALAVTKDWKIFRDIAQKVFHTIDSKKMSSIRKEWISVRYEHGFPWEKTFYWAGVIGAILLFLFLIFYFWNRSLEQQITLRLKNEKEIKSSLEKFRKQDLQKKALLQEIHHRVKNNLQIITSLIRLQANSYVNKNSALLLNQSIDRIRAVALIHEKTYSARDLNKISTQEYIESLTLEIIESFNSQEYIDLKVTTNESSMDSTTIVPLGLILNELITNSIKFSLKNQRKGIITIDILDLNNELKMTYSDNGKWVNNLKTEKDVSSIIEIFTEQLDGEFSLQKTVERTKYCFLFKRKRPSTNSALHI